MKNFVQPGDTIDIVAPEKILSGSLITFNELVGVAVTDSDSDFSDDNIAIATTGVFDLAKGATAHAVGTRVMVPSAAFSNNVNVVADTGAETVVGVVVAAALTGDATVRVKINA